MGRFDRYMLSQLLTIFSFFSLVLILVYWINRAVILFDQLIADGQSAWVFLELTALSLPAIIRIVIPIAVFAAGLYVTNRMSGEAELTVVQATGFSPLRLARASLAFGIVTMLLMSALAHLLAPAALHRLNARQAEVAEQATARLIQEGRFITPVDNVTVYVRDVTPGGELRDIFLNDARSAAQTVTYTATSAYLVRSGGMVQLVMIDGLIQNFEVESGRLVTTAFDDLAYDLTPLFPSATNRRRSSRELYTWELFAPSADLRAETRRTAAELGAEAHVRISETLLAIPAALLGFAALIVGGFSRFGVWKQMLGAISLVVVVKGIETMTTSWVRDDPALWPLAYLPPLAGMLIVAALIAHATNPAWWRRFAARRGAAA